MLRRRSLAALCTLALLVGACSSDDGDGDTSTATTGDATEPAAAEPTVVDLAERGEHGVGSLALDLDGRRVVVWYPAADPGAGVEEPTDTFDITSQLAPDLQAQVPAEARVQYPVPAASGAEPDGDGGPYPLVLFSHGFAGFPEQSVDLTTHLASWGYVVAAPEHVERSLGGLLGTAAQGVTASTDPEVLSATLDLVTEAAADPGSPLDGLVDLDHVAVTGHSAGAGATYRTAATDDRIDAFVAYSLGGGSEERPLGDAPTVPGMVMAGTEDATIPVAATRDAYATLGEPKYLVEVAASGHLVFSDLCLIGAEQGGLVGIVEEIGLPIPEDLLRLASDGCGEEAIGVEEAFPAIDGLTVAFLRTYLDGEDGFAGALAEGAVDAGTEAEVTLTVG
ncbi:MAG TPA: dienelactone hydrolase family protein [Iamia sp.]|nr:dienelactone hydrolase family protein [Iamia sp.]